MRLTARFGTEELGVNYSKLTPKIKPQALTVSFSAQRSQSGGSSAVDPQNDGNVTLIGVSVSESDGAVRILSGVTATADGGDVALQSSGSSTVVFDKSLSVAAKASELQALFGTKRLDINLNPPIVRQISGDVYEGDYEVTPGQSAVVLTTVGKAMARNVTVNPIPSNYGLITWNGSTLTVS